MYVATEDLSNEESRTPQREAALLAEILSGQKMGIILRTHLSPEGRQLVVSQEVGMQIVALIQDYTLEQLQICESKVTALEARRTMTIG